MPLAIHWWLKPSVGSKVKGSDVFTVPEDLIKWNGFRTVVADGRAAFLTRERFPTADELILGWPNEVFEQVSLTPSTYVCVLTHDPKFDDPAVTIASPLLEADSIRSKGDVSKLRQFFGVSLIGITSQTDNLAFAQSKVPGMLMMSGPRMVAS